MWKKRKNGAIKIILWREPVCPAGDGREWKIMRLLVVEDEKKLNELITKKLKK